MLWLLIGLALIFLAVLDALWTTLWVDGNAGPMTSRVTTAIWRGFRAVIPRHRHTLLSLSGPVTLAVIVALWVLLLWVGWTALFSADESSLLNTRDKSWATLSGRFYFVAYTMFTMGNGDFSPQGAVWRIVTSLANGSGMFIVTLAITYLLSVLSAVVQKRSVASSITVFGKEAEELVLAEWDGEGFPVLALQLVGLTSQLSALTEQHLAYPILHYYHAAKSATSSAVAIVILDEALTLLSCGVAPEARPPEGLLRSARGTVKSYLNTLQSAFISPADQPPPPPDLSRLRAAGIPVVEDEQFADALASLRARRCLLLGMVENAAWQWPPVAGKDS